MKKMLSQMREIATTTCNNAYLMDDGRILTNREYKALSFVEKLGLVMYYKYNTSEIIKI